MARNANDARLAASSTRKASRSSASQAGIRRVRLASRAMLRVAAVGNVDPQMPPERFWSQCARELDKKLSLALRMESGGPKSGGILRGILLPHQSIKMLLYQ